MTFCQDAAEALAHLAAGLQEERDQYLHLRRPVSQSFGTVLEKVSTTTTLDQSWLHWPLEGTLGSLMACQRCGFQVRSQSNKGLRFRGFQVRLCVLGSVVN